MDEILKCLNRIEKKLDSNLFSEPDDTYIKKCDSLGRVTLPIHIRRLLDIDETTELKIFVVGKQIVIKSAES